MKRHPGLRPLSEDHHHGLVQARRLRLAADGDARTRSLAAHAFAEAWQAEIEPHFEREERLLVPCIAREEAVSRMLADHARLRSLAAALALPGAPAADVCRDLAGCLESHIRWEERELFPLLEQALTEEALQRLGESLHAGERAAGG